MTIRLFQILAFVTGVNLLLLCLWCVNEYVVHAPLPSWADLVPVVHGWFYLAYFFVTLKLGQDYRWPRRTLVTTLLAGTVPFCSFIAERRRTRELRAS